MDGVDSFGQEGPNLPTPPTAGQMQKQAARKRTFEELPKPDIYRSYRQAAPGIRAARPPPHSIVGITKLAPSFTPLGQRAVTVLVRV